MSERREVGIPPSSKRGPVAMSARERGTPASSECGRKQSPARRAESGKQ